MFILRTCLYIGNRHPTMQPDGMFIGLDKGEPFFTDNKAATHLFETKEEAKAMAKTLATRCPALFICEAEVKPVLYRTTGGELVE